MATKIITELYEQLSLFTDDVPVMHAGNKSRTSPMFLRNQFVGFGKYGIPFVKKQDIPLDDLNLIAYTNTRKHEP